MGGYRGPNTRDTPTQREILLKSCGHKQLAAWTASLPASGAAPVVRADSHPIMPFQRLTPIKLDLKLLPAKQSQQQGVLTALAMAFASMDLPVPGGPQSKAHHACLLLNPISALAPALRSQGKPAAGCPHLPRHGLCQHGLAGARGPVQQHTLHGAPQQGADGIVLFQRPQHAQALGGAAQAGASRERFGKEQQALRLLVARLMGLAPETVCMTSAVTLVHACPKSRVQAARTRLPDRSSQCMRMVANKHPLLPGRGQHALCTLLAEKDRAMHGCYHVPLDSLQPPNVIQRHVYVVRVEHAGRQ